MTEHILHIARLKNNCPVCYATDGLEISFVQNETETRFYNKAENEITETIYCHTCKNIVYPVNWNDDIERIYEYHKKQVVPIKSHLRIKPIAYVIILSVAVISISLVYLFSKA